MNSNETSYQEVGILPCASGFGEYQLSEGGESWSDINDLEAAIRDAVDLMDWDEIEGTELDISGRIHNESSLIRKYAWREAGTIHYCGII